VNWVNAVVQGVLLGGLYALFATGLSLAFGVMRFVNLAHGDLAVLGAYFVVAWAGAFGGNYWFTMVAVVAVMVIVGYVSQRTLFNRTLGADPLPGILATFGLGIVIQNALLEHFTATDKSIPLGDILVKSIKLTDQLSVGWFPLITFCVAVALLAGLQMFLSFTPTGRAFRATADDPATAQLMGIDYRHVYGLAMAISFGAVALAGFFNGARTPFTPSTGGLLLLFAFEAVVIGGLGSLWGTLLGGVVLGVAQNMGNQWQVGTGVLVGHLMFLAVLALRPHGLLGSPART
jgi:branched-chain amino acid transport system permease protein